MADDARSISARLAPVDPAADVLFVYGTLRFPRILTALLGRAPAAVPAAVAGWRTAALRARPYPGLVPAPGSTAPGLLLSGLSAREWRVLDDFEDTEYELRELALDPAPAPGAGPSGLSPTAWAYTWAAPAEVSEHTWDAGEFAAHRLDTYAARLEAAAGRGA